MSELSVIVIGLNEGEHLERCFKSVVAAVDRASSAITSWEIIYVDSGSTDDSTRTARRYATRTLLIASHPTAAAGRNVGIARSHGSLLLFLDGDMALYPDWLASALSHLEHAGEEYVGVSGIRNDVYWDSVDCRVIGERQNVYGAKVVGRASRVGGAVLLKRDAVLGVGGYRSKMKIWEDPDLHARLRSRKKYILEVPEPFIRHYTPAPAPALRRIRQLMRPNGSAIRFGEWFLSAHEKGYTRGFLEVNRTTALIALLDATLLVTANRMGMRVWLAGQTALVTVGLMIGMRRQLITSRLWEVGVLLAIMRRLLGARAHDDDFLDDLPIAHIEL